MTTRLTDFKQSEFESIEDPGRNGRGCEVAVICHAEAGIRHITAYRYVCGWVGADTVTWCTKRGRFLAMTL